MAKRYKTSWSILFFDSPSFLRGLAAWRKPSETAASDKAADRFPIGSSSLGRTGRLRELVGGVPYEPEFEHLQTGLSRYLAGSAGRVFP